MMPFSYQGFGFTAIVLMVFFLTAAQLIRYLRDRYFRHDP
jgi:hypothetical protein